MLLLQLLFALLFPLMCGYICTALIVQNKTHLTFIERFSLSWGIGIGLLGIEMFTVSLLGFPVNLWSTIAPAMVILLPALFFLMIKKINIFDLHSTNFIFKSTVAENILAAGILLVIAFVFFEALIKPIVNFDDLWRQGCIAKIIFTTGKVITPLSVEVAGGHPYLNPLSQAWIYLGIGAWNDALGKIIFPMCFLSLLLIFYSNLRKSTSRLNALFFTYLLTSFPLMAYHAGTAYSDLMQTFYYSSGAIYLARWLKGKEPAHLYLSALLLGFGNFVKQSGIPLWIAAAVVLFVYLFFEDKNRLKQGIAFMLISILVSSPWLFYHNSFLMTRLTSLGGLFIGSEAPASSALPYGNPSFWGILSHLTRRMFTYADWQILWFAFIFILILDWKRIFKSELKYILLIILFNLAMVFYAFSEPSTYQFLVDGTLVNRLMMYQAPLVLFFISSGLAPLAARRAKGEVFMPEIAEENVDKNKPALGHRRR